MGDNTYDSGREEIYFLFSFFSDNASSVATPIFYNKTN
jgi:hypothetical protein